MHLIISYIFEEYLGIFLKSPNLKLSDSHEGVGK